MKDIARHEFAVTGMHCNGCVKSVTRAVAQLPGVKAVDVSLERNAASVEYDTGVLDAATIVAAIGAAGFEASAR